MGNLVMGKQSVLNDLQLLANMTAIKDGGTSFRTVKETGIYRFDDISIDLPVQPSAGSVHAKGFDFYDAITDSSLAPAFGLVMVSGGGEMGDEGTYIEAYILQAGRFLYYSGDGGNEQPTELYQWNICLNQRMINSEEYQGSGFTPVGFSN
jgi:hypothetical protein